MPNADRIISVSHRNPQMWPSKLYLLSPSSLARCGAVLEFKNHIQVTCMTFNSLAIRPVGIDSAS